MLDLMPPEMADQRIIAAIEAARPAARGRLQVERLLSWQTNPKAGGIYHHIRKGIAADLPSADEHCGQGLHFAAGEHLARSSSGMEGALKNGEQVGLRVAEMF